MPARGGHFDRSHQEFTSWLQLSWRQRLQLLPSWRQQLRSSWQQRLQPLPSFRQRLFLSWRPWRQLFLPWSSWLAWQRLREQRMRQEQQRVRLQQRVRKQAWRRELVRMHQRRRGQRSEQRGFCSFGISLKTLLEKIPRTSRRPFRNGAPSPAVDTSPQILFPRGFTARI